MQADLRPENVIITGAGSGIGRALARRLAVQGHSLILVDRRAEALDTLRQEISGGNHLWLTADTTSSESVSEMFSQVKKEERLLTGLVHCAGIHWLRPIQLTTPEQLQEMMASHVSSSLHLLREGIAQRIFDKAGASVVLMSSAAALQGGPGSFAYAAAKGALISAARVAAMEFARRSIRVNVIAPGVVETPQSRAFMEQLPTEQQDAIRRDHPLGLGQPEDVAAAADFLLSRDARWITGTTLVVDGGLTAH